ncbi:TPA: hypothetical protein ACPZND_000188 [Yersinia enterocolitica]
MIKTITAAPVERDNCGFWTHPDYFEPANGNEFGVEGEFAAWKALNRVTGAIGWMENEENAEELQAEYDSANCSVSMWNPTPPDGDGWFMASIHETEDGPVCYWLRPIECDPEALEAAQKERDELRDKFNEISVQKQFWVKCAKELESQIEKAEAELSAVQLDATRWRAMLSSPAIRILGYAGLQDDKPIDGHYCHFGMEIWSHYEPYYDDKKAGELITRYADNMIAASLVEGNADAE